MKKIILFLTLSLLVFMSSSCNKEKTAKLTVTVKLQGLSQTAGINVSICEEPSGVQVAKGETDSDGEIVFKDLLSGTYRVDGYHAISQLQVLQGDKVIQLVEKDKEEMTLILTDD